ncbi:MAG: PorV/PorQ family protein [Candidatus Marinimicrobia bacterium]|nr:PorV/PorQ family protein [Candidatus Neomarinimicrobiota bacterium]
MKILFYTLLFAAVQLPQALYAGDPSSTGMSFLKLGVDAASTAMGGTGVSNSKGAVASYWNPAGLASADNSDVLISHQEWLAGSSNQYLGVSFPGSSYSFGLSLALSGVSDIERRDERPTAEPLSYFSANSIALSLSAAAGRGSDLQFGVTAKLLYEKISFYTANGFAFDFGLIKSLNFHNLKTALVVKDVGGMSSLNNESTSLPARVTAGISGKLNPRSTTSFNWALDAGKYFESGTFIRLGGELNLKEILSLRGGYKRNSENSSGITAGIGITRNRYRFDYAYLPFDFNLGDTHQMSFGIGF